MKRRRNSKEVVEDFYEELLSGKQTRKRPPPPSNRTSNPLPPNLADWPKLPPDQKWKSFIFQQALQQQYGRTPKHSEKSEERWRLMELQNRRGRHARPVGQETPWHPPMYLPDEDMTDWPDSRINTNAH